MLNEKVICAGFGGQGVMSIGQLLAYGGMLDNHNVTWLPSYGPEMRGGTAYCSVMISKEPVGSPVISRDATSAIVMNLPSLRKFESYVISGGDLLINSSMVSELAERDDLNCYYIPANDIAKECGSDRAANMVMLGAYLAIHPVVSQASVKKAFLKVFGDKAEKLLELNMSAIEGGAASVRDTLRLNRAA
ncbi:2-oxoacid:acceptor oxidoreductase family protein [Desulfosediminicola flagellatus]|uniref:2-oxoacid:acceptor oxidoreductase family protein n=1 Tax=Desulfosediminicola flagellatus TaxID=2569541 RepID=UPI0010ACF59E|nr:2-oxoacid:acceptor oxidoreductase family protein [Desulfosediminicola flagellatus]